MVYFGEASQQTIQSLFLSILQPNGMSLAPYTLILIEGLEVTIEEYAKDCLSRNYRIYDNGCWKWLIKQLPTFCLLSNQLHDINVFIEARGAFSEGRMSLFCIDPNVAPLFQWGSTKEVLLEQVKHTSSLCIDMFPDGEGIEVSLYSPEYHFDSVLSWLSRVGASSTGEHHSTGDA